LFDYTAQIGLTSTLWHSRHGRQAIKIATRMWASSWTTPRRLDKFGMVYDNISFDIEDPGQWTINGPLGELLRVAGTRAGSGSTWIEVDLKFALDLGVIRITGCTLRLDFPTGGGCPDRVRALAQPSISRERCEGSGMLSIGDGGALRAGIDMNVIPAKVLARGSLAIQGDSPRSR